MAEIPVERKQGGLPWWLIPLLLALVLIPLLIFFTRGCGDAVGNANNANANRSVVNPSNSNANTVNRNVAVANTNTANTTATGAAITDVNYFAGINDKNSLVGRSVNLQNVKVDRVLSDHVFTVKSGSGEMFVYLDESQDSGGGKEQQVKIKSGQNLNLSGDFRAVPTAEIATEKNEKQTGGLTNKEYEQMKGQQVYLHGVSR